MKVVSLIWDLVSTNCATNECPCIQGKSEKCTWATRLPRSGQHEAVTDLMVFPGFCLSCHEGFQGVRRVGGMRGQVHCVDIMEYGIVIEILRWGESWLCSYYLDAAVHEAFESQLLHL